MADHHHRPRVEPLDEESVEHIRRRYRELVEGVRQAEPLVAAGRYGEAERLLAEVEPLAQEFVSKDSFLVFRLLGQCARVAMRTEDAKRYYGRAFQLAVPVRRVRPPAGRRPVQRGDRRVRFGSAG